MQLKGNGVDTWDCTRAVLYFIRTSIFLGMSESFAPRPDRFTMKKKSKKLASNRQSILRAIQQRFSNRQPLNITAVKRDDPKLVRQVYEQRPYWGWKAALADAGLTYDKIRIEIEQTVVCKLCGKRLASLIGHVTQLHLIECREYLDEFPGAELVSEQLRSNSMGGIKKPHPEWLKHWEPVYSLEYLLDRLKEYADLGFSINHDNLVAIDTSLPVTLKKYGGFNDWDDAIRTIDLDPVDYRGLVHSDDFTLSQFQAWLAERERAGRSCLYQDVVAERDHWQRRSMIAVWALRQYGSWAAALDQAGVDRGLPIYGGRHNFTTQDVLARIKQLRRDGLDLARKSVVLMPDGMAIVTAAVRDFGTWESALDAAKVPLRERERRVCFETKGEVLDGIRVRMKNDWSLAPIELFYGSRNDMTLFKKAFQFWDSWGDAVQAAGGNREQLKQAVDTPYTSKAKVVAELKRRGRQGKLLAVRELTESVADKQLYVMANGYFGKWQEAVRAAGEDPRKYHQWNLESPGKYKSPEQVLTAIRQRHRKKLPLHTRGLTHGEQMDVPLLYTARKLFGNWQAAIENAKIDYSKIARKTQDYDAMKGRVYRTYPSKEEVRAEVQRRYASELPVTYRELCHSKDPEIRDNGLLTAGKKFFGDWDKALRHAGIDPTEVQEPWVQERKARLRKKAKGRP